MADSNIVTAKTEAGEEVAITLHWLNKSRSHRILWLLEELKVPYNLKTYKRGPDMLAGEDLKKIHPLGKSPVITVKPKDGEAYTLAESGVIVEFITQYFGKHMIPAQYQAGKEGFISGETATWKQYRHYMHYAEGSLMTIMVIALIVLQIKHAPVPFFIRPIPRFVASRVESGFLNRNIKLHFDFLEAELKKTEGGQHFFCGKELTGADIMLIFPLEAALESNRVESVTKAKYPTLAGWVERIHARPAYKKAVEAIKEKTGTYDPVLG